MEPAAPAREAAGSRRSWRDVYRRFHGLDALGKLAVSFAVLLSCAGVTQGTMRVWHGRPPDALRHEVRRCLAALDYAGAQRALAVLAAKTHGLDESDRFELEAPVRSGLARLERVYRHEIDEHRRAGRWRHALVALEDMQAMGLAPPWQSWIRAEVLGALGRHREAAAELLRYVEAHPDGARADAALYWASISYRRAGMPKAAAAAMRRLVARYPTSRLRDLVEREIASPVAAQ